MIEFHPPSSQSSPNGEQRLMLLIFYQRKKNNVGIGDHVKNEKESTKVENLQRRETLKKQRKEMDIKKGILRHETKKYNNLSTEGNTRKEHAFNHTLQ